MTRPIYAAGADGCPGGWLCVAFPLDEGPKAARSTLYPDIERLLEALGASTLLAVDMPIGFPDTAEQGGRQAEREARAVLGGRQSSVFATPARAALGAEDYRAACTLNRAHSKPPKGLSKQCWNLFPKIRELDAVLTPALQARVKECHPEVAFWVLNGCQALETPKKVKSRPNPEGLAQRRRLLEAQGYPPDFLIPTLTGSKVGPDDLLDACAIATTAARIVAGTAHRFPVGEVPYDARGLAMEIWG